MKELPKALYLTLGIVAFAAVAQFIAAFKTPTLLISVVLNIALLYGIYIGSRIAFVASIIAVIVGTISALFRDPHTGLIVVIIDVAALVPMFMYREYFWPKEVA